MSAPQLVNLGTLTTDGTEQIIYQSNVPGIFKFCVDTTNLAGGDTIVVKLYKRIDPLGSFVLLSTNTYSGVQTVPMKEFGDLTLMRANEMKITLQRTGGSDRDYFWILESF